MPKNDNEEFKTKLALALIGDCNLSTDELLAKIDECARNYSVIKMQTTLPCAGDGSTTKYLMGKFFENKVALGMNSDSIEQYSLTVKQFLEVLHIEINLATNEDITRFLTYCRAVLGNKSATIGNKYRHLSSIYNFLYRYKYISENPIDLVDPPKVHSEKKTPLTVREWENIKLVCEHSKNPTKGTRMLAMLNLLFDSGIRVSEMCNIKFEDIDFDQKSIRIFGKGSKWRQVYFTDRFLVRLAEYMKHRDDVITDNGVTQFASGTYLFVTLRKGPDGTYGKLRKDNVEQEFRDLGKASGVIRLHPHLVRATFATRLASNGIQIDMIADLLGHADLHTIHRYVIQSPASKSQAVNSGM